MAPITLNATLKLHEEDFLSLMVAAARYFAAGAGIESGLTVT